MKYLLLFLIVTLSVEGFSQVYTSSNIHAHNDYVNPIPFFDAYSKEAGSIEADVFFKNNELYVAHTEQEIDNERTLDNLYLKPLQEKIKKHQGYAFSTKDKLLVLMIDLKTEGTATLNFLVKKLKEYPTLIACKTLSITITGNYPPPAEWSRYPKSIYFDGRPNVSYTDEQLQRINIISADLKDYTDWNGKGTLTKEDRKKIKDVIHSIHNKNKKVRFWATPDHVNAWITLINLGVDYIGTDKVEKLSSYLQDRTKSSFKNDSYYETYTPKESENQQPKSFPKNIILMIGDGMGLTQLYAGYTANRGKLNIFKIPTIGLSITNSADSYITDSGAGGTAMATGHKTNNRFIGVDSLGNTLESLTMRLKKQGYKTSIISSGDITDATPAAFYAHQPERSWSEQIANDFLSTKSDILIGGGTEAFNHRKDNKNIAEVLEKSGYTFSKRFTSIDSINNQQFVLLDNASVVSKKQGRGDFLSKSIVKSLSTFTQTKAPFFMMAEGAQIDYGGHGNDMEYVVRELLDFDRAAGEAMKFVDNNEETLLIITADHETGGLTLLDGNIETGYVHGNFSTNDHTAVLVPVFAYGKGAEYFRGVYQNTEIFKKIVMLASGLK